MARSEEADDVIGELVQAGVELRLQGDLLSYHGLRSELDMRAVARLREHKPAIVDRLRANQLRGVHALAPTSQEHREILRRNASARHPASCNICLRFDLVGPVDTTLLDEVLRALVARHEALRTRFSPYGDAVLQEIMVPPCGVLEIFGPAPLAGAGSTEVAEWCTRLGTGRFNLATETPIRCWYAPLERERSVLVVALHHVACDGWSIDTLVAEGVRLYRQAREGTELPELPPLPLGSLEFARWERGWLTAERVGHEVAFWSEDLRGATLRPKLRRSTGAGSVVDEAAYVTRQLSRVQTGRLLAFSRSLSTTEFVVYLAAFMMLLREEVVGGRCVVLLAVANRTREEHEGLVGAYHGSMPILCSVADGASIQDVAAEIGARIRRAMDHQSCPLEAIVEKLDDDAEPEPLFPVGFALYQDMAAEIDCPNVAVSIEDVAVGGPRAVLTLIVRRKGESAEVQVEYARSHLRDADAKEIVDRYERLLQAVSVSQPRAAEAANA